MKKLSLTLLTILTCGALHALPVGNPADPALLCDGLFFEGTCCLDFCDPGASWCQALSFRIGYYGDFVFQRHLEIDRHEASDYIENSELFTNAGYFVINAWDRIDFFFTLGATNIFIETNYSSFSLPTVITPPAFPAGGNRFTIETETDFSWSIGARLILWQCGCTTLGAEAQYFSTRPSIERITAADRVSAYIDDNITLKYREWQFGLGIAHRINIFVPYAAIKWAGVKVDMDDARFDLSVDGVNDVILHNLENRKDVGYAIGVTLTDCWKKSLTIEARFADEKALYVNGQIRF